MEVPADLRLVGILRSVKPDAAAARTFGHKVVADLRVVGMAHGTINQTQGLLTSCKSIVRSVER